MGSGKTTHGRKLAKALGFRFIDLDEHIMQAEGKSVAAIFADEGEAHFRRLETEHLQAIGRENIPTVLSVGGGTPCFHHNMQWMRDSGTVIYIRMDAKALCTRLIQAKEERPLIKGKSEEELLTFISDLLARRESFYLQAHHSINGISLKTEELIALL